MEKKEVRLSLSLSCQIGRNPARCINPTLAIHLMGTEGKVSISDSPSLAHENANKIIFFSMLIF